MKDLKNFKFEPESLELYTDASKAFSTVSVLQQCAYVAQISQAISLKRIADSLETLVGHPGQQNMNEILWDIKEVIRAK